jgi:hypothetical protein
MTDFCCKMRRHFLIGVVGARNSESLPVEAGEFIEDFTAQQPKILTRFCSFCGARIAGQPTSTSWTPFPPEVSP